MICDGYLMWKEDGVEGEVGKGKVSVKGMENKVNMDEIEKGIVVGIKSSFRR